MTPDPRAALRWLKLNAENHVSAIADAETKGTVSKWHLLRAELIRDAVLKLEAALAAAPVSADGWQPIATAPKDEDVILLYLDGSGVQPGYWEDDEWWACETQGLTGGKWHSEPTHWQPLPAPPAEEKA